MKKMLHSLSLLFAMSLVTFAHAGLKSMDGKAGKLSDYTGKGDWTVVIMWASDCHVCNTEAEQYIQYYESNKGKGVKVVGVTLDGQAKLDDAKAFIKRHDVTYPNLIGEPQEVAAMYESLTGGRWVGTPTFLIYDRKSTLKAAQPGAVPAEIINEFIREDDTQPVKN